MVHLQVVGAALDHATAAFVRDHAGVTQDMQVIGQRGTRQSGGLCQFTNRHPLAASPYQQTKEVETVLLGQGIEARQGCI